MNITGFLNWWRGSSFGNESAIAARTSSRENTLVRLARVIGDGAAGDAAGGAVVVDIYFFPRLSRARLSSRTLTPDSPKIPQERPSVFSLTSFCTVASGRWRIAATR